ncbi:MBOAT family O-acyltransferase [Fulvivirgaceae bacterium BMA12]|uniref:MBOAT family O-acyltransferase n=1 Tax=Agaribacillus aureus TaxID=3051825 RepID=A0ABT8LDY8_9BACT|nr:MBOAT family O-acyltransferase [Fulvivirgaceae bacterium BMA12]
MLFNSIEFAIFLPIVFLLYWFIFNKSIFFQNFLLLVVSYIFYGWWDWRFLSLIIFSSLVDYFIGIKLSKTGNQRRRKLLLTASLLVNLGFLGFFKYFNFFVDSFVEAFTLFGSSFEPTRLSVILPVGISFYTFQTMSYTIDVYKGKLQPTRDIIAFFAFVSFFPQLVAGPIERAKNLLPQFSEKRRFEYDKAVDGLRQILWGLFKKMIIADNCAVVVDEIFFNYAEYSGSTLLMGALFFSFQIYGDFSGYSDIAIGTARLFGFSLMQNFAFPYFSRDMAEFWRRWHISLSTWFRDYLYIPLGGSRGSMWAKIRNIFIIFIVSGFWHGANWTFIVWGGLNALYFLPLSLLNKNRTNLDIVAKGKYLPTIREAFNMGLTFGLTVLAWVFFRAESVTHAFAYMGGMFSDSLLSYPEIVIKNLILLLGAFTLIEWFGREGQYAFANVSLLRPRPLRWFVYFFVIGLLFYFKANQPQPFVYFQF